MGLRGRKDRLLMSAELLPSRTNALLATPSLCRRICKQIPLRRLASPLVLGVLGWSVMKHASARRKASLLGGLLLVGFPKEPGAPHEDECLTQDLNPAGFDLDPQGGQGGCSQKGAIVDEEQQQEQQPSAN